MEPYLQKPHYMKNSEYKTDFKEISIPFNEKIFKIWKLKVPLGTDPPKLNQNKQKAAKKINKKYKKKMCKKNEIK